VALARVLALEPEILLLDEPLVILIILERMPCAEICLLT
jgi:ABC-type taurine transport system ATPase subunit